MDFMDAALKETPSVEKDSGPSPLLTPTSQIIGVQAVLNVLAGERYKIVSRETSDYVKGKYGLPPGRGEPRLDPENHERQTARLLACAPAKWPIRRIWEKAIKDLGCASKER